MPYRVRGTWVQIKRDGKWVPFKRHTTHERARRHAAALNINVGHGRKKSDAQTPK